MQVVDKVKGTEFLGRDFLVWLWFYSESHNGAFDIPGGGVVDLWLEGRVVLESADEERTETVTCTGENPGLREARFALSAGKKLTQARIRLTVGDNEWTFLLDSTWLNFKSLRTPRVMQDRKDDPDGVFYEKIYLVEQPIAVMDALFAQFIKLRLSPQWEEEELPRITRWVEKGSR